MNIDHHSPSSLNLFCASPAMYVLERILGEKRPGSANMHRGTAVEAGVALGLVNPESSNADCIDAALTKYDALMTFSADARRQKVRDEIPDMVEMALLQLRGHGKPSGLQGACEWHPEGLRHRIIGYYDFAWDDKGILVDLKTSDKMPPGRQIKVTHARQVALYAPSDNYDAQVTYVTPKQTLTLRLENIRAHREALKNIALTVERWLAQSDDPQWFVDHTAPDLESFYWTSPEARTLAYKYWRV